MLGEMCYFPTFPTQSTIACAGVFNSEVHFPQVCECLRVCCLRYSWTPSRPPWISWMKPCDLYQGYLHQKEREKSGDHPWFTLAMDGPLWCRPRWPNAHPPVSRKDLFPLRVRADMERGPSQKPSPGLPRGSHFGKTKDAQTKQRFLHLASL